jgi:proteasome accessory factor A
MGWALLAIQLAELGDEPPFVLQDPVSAFHAVSRYLQKRDPIPLSSGSWTDAPTVLRTYLDHACKRLNLNAEMCSFVEDCYALLDNLQSNGHPHDEEFATKVEWAAKLGLMEDLIRSENLNWSNPILKSVDLEFTHIDPDNSLYHGMLASGMVEPETDEQVQARNSLRAAPATRAAARAAALTKFGDRVWTASWGSVVIDDGQQIGEIRLPPEAQFGPELETIESVSAFKKIVDEGSRPR